MQLLKLEKNIMFIEYISLDEIILIWMVFII